MQASQPSSAPNTAFRDMNPSKKVPVSSIQFTQTEMGYWIKE